jgi:subtilisin family serine protease
MSGTSQATAFVTGIAALLLAKNPSLTPQQLKQIIIDSVDHFPQLEDRVISGGRVNAYRALNLLKNNSPAFSKANPFFQVSFKNEKNQSTGADTPQQND